MTPSQAAVYKYVDADGNITFSDRYRPGAVKFLDSGSGTALSTSPRKRAGIPTPADFPRVDRNTQNKRDDVRRSLLQEERSNEENALSGIRTQLIDGKPRSTAELNKLQESRRLHEKNIEMLDKELARIK
ncbi:MAG: DUF4124 domain-containing protein [Thiobacillus sp.]|nr:DUF4124 domain-containing protein [Thiobacillus sp.]